MTVEKNDKDTKQNGAAEKESQLQAQIDELKRSVELEKNARLKAEVAIETSRAKAEDDAEARRLLDEADIKKLLRGDEQAPKARADIDELTPSQMLDIIGEAVDKTSVAQAAQTRKVIEAALAKTAEETKAIKGVVGQIIAKLNVDAARSKFEDFDEVTPKVREILDTYPGLEVEDAYILAKGRLAGQAPPAKKTETERPDSHLTRTNLARDESSAMSKAERAAAKREEDVMKPSASGRNFRSLVEAAAEKVLTARGLKD